MKQKVFIGSSTEGRAVCDALMVQLSGVFEVTPWHISFPTSHTAIEALLTGFTGHDFGVFVLSNDDKANVRGRNVVLPRDNVLFEAGMFMGMHGLRRTFLVCPTGVADFHLLSDIGGVTYIPYDFSASSIPVAVAPAAQRIKEAIARVNNEMRNVEVRVRRIRHSMTPGLTWPVKVQFDIENKTATPVTLQSRYFKFGKARQSTNNYVLGGGVHNVAFKRWFASGSDGRDQYHEVVFLQPGEKVEAWVALDKAHTDAELAALESSKDVGIWTYRATWHDLIPEARDYVLSI